ncbi:protein ImuB [Paracoccus halophilus]|uniref:DNA-directed DNA polymerase n=1 Tax=Paracoccus halophilus TaxID=376733 RepID=A0A099F1V7_9RHOB|nr:DNA polymerase Y family protein [Paracoccus halophilus]KGJ04258.1 nucleotidyltransferase [Paracoccus halophilus]SFA52184.1 protein ImuB [Paracoccus halophilus]
MFDGARRRVVSLWFPRLASDRALRARPVAGPFALTLRADNTNRIHCLNPEAERRGLYRGMAFSDARAYCPELLSRLADPMADRRFLTGLRRWATRYCPWVGIEGDDGLVLDITGAAHLAGGEEAMLGDLRQRLCRGGLTVRIGLGDTRGAAWALAHHGEGVAPPGEALAVLGPLPVAGLRLDADSVTALQRLGLRTIAQLAAAARAPLARRFGPGLLMRLDQALGTQPEEISPQAEPPHYGLRMNLPEPIGLQADVMAGTARLLARLCDKLNRQETGARVLCLTLRRIDSQSRHVELRLARPMRDPARILPLFARGIDEVDAGFGIDQLRLEATQVEPLPVEQISHAGPDRQGRVADLITRIGARIGLENVQRFLPADSHIPERSFIIAPAAFSRPETGWNIPCPRPLIIFPPEAIAASGPRPPRHFRWRRMRLTTLRATGPERIAPEWWLDDENWRSGMRDYWRLETTEGRRLWLFHTPQNPGWFVQGEFP